MHVHRKAPHPVVGCVGFDAADWTGHPGIVHEDFHRAVRFGLVRRKSTSLPDFLLGNAPTLALD